MSWFTGRKTLKNIIIVIAVLAVVVAAIFYIKNNFFKADEAFKITSTRPDPEVVNLEKANNARRLTDDEIAVIKTSDKSPSSGQEKYLRTPSGYAIPSDILGQGVFQVVEGQNGHPMVGLTNTRIFQKSELTGIDQRILGSEDSSVIDNITQSIEKNKSARVIVKLKKADSIYQLGVEPAKVQSSLAQFQKERISVQSLFKNHGILRSDLPIIYSFSAEVDLTGYQNLLKDERVEKVDLASKVNATLDQAAPEISADKAWTMPDENSLPITGSGVKIAILDTGVDYTHPDLGGCLGSTCKVTGGYDFVNNDNDPMDDQGHGTHVAATAAGKGMLKGIAPDASIVAYKVLDYEGGGWNDDIVRAIDYTTDPNQDGDTVDHLDVASMSLGGDGDPSDAMSQAVDRATALGVTFVVAAGNSGSSNNTINSPGTAQTAITVAASCRPDQVSSGVYYCSKKIADFSSRGPVTDLNGKDYQKPDVAAPGVRICAAEWGSSFLTSLDSQCLDNHHVSLSGTSMATPQVAGAAALLKQSDKTLTPAQIKTRLKSTAVSLEMDYNSQGAGEINIANALELSDPGFTTERLCC
ncbi:MAG: S8 family serine peptidase [Candidatus Berkelbacteria bacterium]|nr:S8 family serine peptidase [Candidatus Berkelbacteria bacterium]